MTNEFRESVAHYLETREIDPEAYIYDYDYHTLVNLVRFNNPPTIDAIHIAKQRDWSEKTFGPGERIAGVVDHIRKELIEVENDPYGWEWIDIIILALDGAWRAGHQPQEIIDAIISKQRENERRQWPDWRTAEPGKAIEHIRG